nr:MAG TPA: hypothetical protein [Caudoviricetes sp.]DAY23688.1 MAG TPA: hypothetical protein [Caudoviricetes sp.]
MIFHWPPAVFEKMPLVELMTWREKARQRAETEE